MTPIWQCPGEPWIGAHVSIIAETKLEARVRRPVDRHMRLSLRQRRLEVAGWDAWLASNQ